MASFCYLNTASNATALLIYLANNGQKNEEEASFVSCATDQQWSVLLQSGPSMNKIYRL